MQLMNQSIHNFDHIINNIQVSKSIVIAGHISPDGDTVGSSLALKLILDAMGKKAQVVFADVIPQNLLFLPSVGEIILPEQLDYTPDLIILVDCAALARVGEGWIEQYLDVSTIMVIDHHALREGIFLEGVVDEKAAATGELIYDFALATGVEITQNIATCIYSAIASDTACFRFSNTTQRTFGIAQDLLTKGISLDQIRINLFETKSLASMALISRALNHLQQSSDQKLVWTYIEQKDKDEVNSDLGDCESISGFTMMPAGVKVGVFFQEMGDTECVKISMRGRQGYNVGQVAAKFNGGGHIAAAGCRVCAPLKDAMEQVLKTVRVMIDECEDSNK